MENAWSTLLIWAISLFQLSVPTMGKPQIDANQYISTASNHYVTLGTE